MLYMAGIFYLSSLHQPPLPADVSDKTAHVLAYVGLALVVIRALAGGLPARVTARLAVSALAITVAYGASDEFHQRFVAGRSADLLDLVADAAGAGMAIIVCWTWGIISLRSTPSGAARHDF